MRLLILPVVLISGSPFEGPKNFEGEGRGFPVINVRFDYPPSSIDPRRVLALASRQKEIVKLSSELSARMEEDMQELMEHVLLQREISGFLNRIPSDLFSPVQRLFLSQLARSSFVETPQINIAIEDNRGDFAQGPEMSPSEGVGMIRAMSRSWMTTRKLVIELVKINFRRMEMLMEFLKPRFEKTAKVIRNLPVAFLQTDPGVDFPLVMALRSRVMQGGREGGKALAGLIDLWNENQGIREAIRSSMVLADCSMLLMMKKTPDYVKNLAGTLMSLISGIPVWSAVPDVASGSSAHVNIVVPRPSRTYRADKQLALTMMRGNSFLILSMVVLLQGCWELVPCDPLKTDRGSAVLMVDEDSKLRLFGQVSCAGKPHVSSFRMMLSEAQCPATGSADGNRIIAQINESCLDEDALALRAQERLESDYFGSAYTMDEILHASDVSVTCNGAKAELSLWSGWTVNVAGVLESKFVLLKLDKIKTHESVVAMLEPVGSFLKGTEYTEDIEVDFDQTLQSVSTLTDHGGKVTVQLHPTVDSPLIAVTMKFADEEPLRELSERCKECIDGIDKGGSECLTKRIRNQCGQVVDLSCEAELGLIRRSCSRFCI